MSVSAHFLRPPRIGPVLGRLERLKAGRTVTVVRANLEQSGETCVEATINLGRFPAAEPEWADLPEMPVNPPAEAVNLGSSHGFALTRTCDVRLDPKGVGSSPEVPPIRLAFGFGPDPATPSLICCSPW